MKERDPFSGSLFERSPISNATTERVERPIVPNPEKELEVVETSDEIFRLTSQPRPTDSSRFCMAHGKFEEDVAIYIDGKRAKFLCPASAEERGAWKWEGKWPEGK